MITVTICRTEYSFDDETDSYWSGDSDASIENLSFRELVQLMRRDYRIPSMSPVTNIGRCWLSDGGDTDYRTGNYFERTLHYSDTDSRVKYWERAMRAAGIIK